MNTTPSLTAHRNLILLARILDRLERSARPDAEQFRAVAGRVAAELETVPRDAALSEPAPLAESPAAPSRPAGS